MEIPAIAHASALLAFVFAEPGAPVRTADRSWSKVPDLGVEVLLIR